MLLLIEMASISGHPVIAPLCGAALRVLSCLSVKATIGNMICTSTLMTALNTKLVKWSEALPVRVVEGGRGEREGKKEGGGEREGGGACCEDRYWLQLHRIGMHSSVTQMRKFRKSLQRNKCFVLFS